MKAFQYLSVFALFIPTFSHFNVARQPDLFIFIARHWCVDGNSSVYVTIKNQGTAPSVACILAVKPLFATEECIKSTEVNVPALKPDAETTVEVYLRNEIKTCRCASGGKGSDRKILLIVDATEINEESDETNNEKVLRYSGLD
jgi:subtilase family serine protease